MSDLFLILLPISLVFMPVLIMLFILLQDRYRRAKHPRYFELYAVALDASKQVHDYYLKNLEPFNNVVNVFTKSHDDGVISDEQFVILTPALTEAFNTYNNKYESLRDESKLLWSAVNKYAVDHDLKWGKVL